jgi:DNA-binding transcriptional ArsR family regulator
MMGPLAFIRVLCGRICGEGDLVDLDLAKALGHPLRVEILAAASRCLISPAEFARHRDEPLDIVRYHFRQLVRHGALELIEARQGESPARHHYRATPCAAPVGLALDSEARG